MSSLSKPVRYSAKCKDCNFEVDDTDMTSSATRVAFHVVTTFHVVKRTSPKQDWSDLT